MDPRRESLSAQVPMADLLQDAFEVALRGDRDALATLLLLLKTKAGRSVFAPLRTRRGPSAPAPADPASRPSVQEFLEELRTGALRELPDDERGEAVRFFVSFCDRNLEKHRRDSSVQRMQAESPKQAEARRSPSTSVPPPASPRREEAWKLLQGEIGTLDAFDRLILERFLAGVPFAEMAKETGRKVAAVEVHISRIKQRIADRLALQCGARSETSLLPDREPSCAPRRKEILEALEELPVEAQAAIDFVHVKGRSIVELARSLGDRGLEKAQARLELGYESLACKLDIPFPESFEFLKL
jgi:DNA-directed RNA polymerase specialized sigma24 family protein